MSVRMMTLAWECEVDLTSTELLVLVKLADQANDDGEAWPSQTTIARHTKIKHRETVCRILGSLERKGIVSRKARPGSSSVYQLHLESDPRSTGNRSAYGGRNQARNAPDSGGGGCDSKSQVGVTQSHRGCDSPVTGGVTQESHRTTNEPSMNVDAVSNGCADRRTGSPPNSTPENPKPEPPKCDPRSVPYKAIADLFHEVLPELRAVKKLTASRKAHVRARWQNELKGLDRWRAYFEAVRRSDFLMGRKDPGPRRQKPWQADFDFLITERAVVRLAEGEYWDD